MSDKVYATVIGFAQFDADKKTLPSGDGVTEVQVIAAGSQQKVTISLFDNRWPGVSITKGDLVAADGEYVQRSFQAKDGTQVTAFQVRPFRLNVNGQRINSAERTVTQAPAASSKAPF